MDKLSYRKFIIWLYKSLLEFKCILLKLKKSNYSLVREIFTENLSNHDTHVSDVQANIFYR